MKVFEVEDKEKVLDIVKDKNLKNLTIILPEETNNKTKDLNFY